MLRITEIPHAGAVTLKLEGKLMSAWVEEVRSLAAGKGRVRLDLSDVAFVDQAGLRLLRELIEHGAELGACSRFVAELLRVDTEWSR